MRLGRFGLVLKGIWAGSGVFKLDSMCVYTGRAWVPEQPAGLPGLCYYSFIFIIIIIVSLIVYLIIIIINYSIN